MAGVAQFGELEFHTIDPDELAMALRGWIRHCHTPEGVHEATAAKEVTLKLAKILGEKNMTSLVKVAHAWPEWKRIVEKHHRVMNN